MHLYQKFITILMMFLAYCYYNYMDISFNLCSEPINLLIGIMSSRSNFEYRNAIRNTWQKNLSSTKNISLVHALFIIGKNCKIPPEDRWDINSCDFWDIQLPKTNHTQWACQLNSSNSDAKTASKGITIKIRHPIVVTKLGVLKSIFEYYENATVILIDSISQSILMKVKFSPIKMGLDIAGYHYLPAGPIVLPKDYEATLMLESDIPNGLLIRQQHSWNCAHKVFAFTNIMYNSRYLTKWNVNSPSAVSFGFQIYDLLGLGNHVDAINFRQQQWNINLEKESSLLEKELETHNDILLIDVVDIYRNLPIKLLQFYKYVAENAYAEFIMKTDDDVFLNIPKIVHDLKKLKIDHSVTSKIWWSRFRKNWAVNRFGKWRELDYESIVYPPFACGLGNIISADILHWLSRNSENLYPYQGEDVSLGIWLAAINPNRIHDYSWQCDSGCENNSFNIGQLTPQEIQNAWIAFQRCSNMCGCN